MTFGQKSLGWVGGDAEYASLDQFRIQREAGTGDWRVVPVPAAKNATWLNDAALLVDGSILSDGARLSISGKRLKLTVAIEDAS